MSLLHNFKKFAQHQNGFPGHVLAIDPGERTGWAWFHNFDLVECGEIQTGTVRLAIVNFSILFRRVLTSAGARPASPNVPVQDQMHVAIEDYRIYSWKSDDHAWSNVHTIKVVGFAEITAMGLYLPYTLRIAQHAKVFATDDRLRQWGFWQRGERHARDAIRHACLYIIDYNNRKSIKSD